MAIILNDENFDKEISGRDKPVVVDFYTDWCGPCSVLGPVLEKVAGEFEGRFILAKANLDDLPLTAQKFGINQIPTVVLFINGQPVSGFIGARPEEIVKEWLEQALKEDEKIVVAAAQEEQELVKEMLEEYAKHAQENGFRLNPKTESVGMIIKGLLANEKKHGKKYCPCRRVTGNKEEDDKIVCPCDYHRQEIEKDGRCHCGLFVK